MILLKNLSWSNIFSYGAENNLRFNEEPITQLLGQNGCLLGDTVIMGPDGEINFIEELVQNYTLEVHKTKKYSTWGLTEDGITKPTEITHFIRSGKKEVFCVQLDSGDKLNITANHQLLTYDRGWIALKELKVNDFILDIRYRPIDILDSSAVDEVYWQILGYLNTEGGLSDIDKKITFTNKDNNIADHLRKLLKTYNSKLDLTCTDKVRLYNYYITFNNSSIEKKNFINYIVKSPNILGYCTEKCFPPEVIRLPDSTLDKLLAIYLDTDGCIEKTNAITFSSSSKKQIQQLLFILRYRFNLRVSIRVKKTYRSDNYEISISRLDQVKKFLARVYPYILSYKKARIDEVLYKESASTSYTYDLVPRSILINSLVKSTSIPLECQKARASLLATKHGITRNNYEILASNGLVDHIKNFDNIKFLRIKKIESIGIHDTYDLTTNTSNFIADGILVHNSGKSSIPLVLEETLFNKNSKGIKKADVVNRALDTNKYSSECSFSIFEKEYVLSISRSGATQKVKLTEDGEDISSHTATATFAKVEALLGLDFKTFSQLVYQNSNSSLQFLTATDTNRKKFLIDLLSLDRYITLFEQIKLLHKNVHESLIGLKSKESTIRQWLMDASKTDLLELELEPLPVLDSTKPTILGELQSQLKEITSINQRIATNKHYKERLDSIDASDLVSTKPMISTKELEAKKAEVQLELRQKTQVVKKYSSLTSSTCQTCEQPIDTSRIKIIIDSAKAEQKDLITIEATILAEIEQARLNNLEVSRHQQLLADFEKFSNLVDNSLGNMLLDKTELEERIAELQKYIENINSENSRVMKLNNSRASHNAKVSAIRGQLDAYNKELSELASSLSLVEKRLSNLEILKKAFSTTGLIAYKIENSVKELEVITNSYLAELSDGRFELLFVLVNDKLNVVIVDNGVEIDISALSAGELCRVTTATLLAIRKLMATLSKSKINVLFLDEVIDVLDQEGKERLVEVLLKEEDLNTFVISHTYSHPLVKKIEIIKENKVSRINNG